MHESSSNLETILQDFDGFSDVDNVPAQYRGTYKGAGYMAEYLKAMGINTIEFLPVHETDNDCNPDDGPGGNYWGYMTYGYFAPDRRYAYDKSPGGPTREFKEMVKAFHDAGIEVYLDVVYNHSGEGGSSETVFLRGLDNSEYYCLDPNDKSVYWETSGCGNNLQCDNPMVRTFIVDSLKYWIEDMGVDGFRFDLAPVLGREFNDTNDRWDFNSSAQTIADITDLIDDYPVTIEMVAEAWDCGSPDGYQVGNFPDGWGEWNGRYRDALRRYVKSDGYGSTDIGDFIYGDNSYFNDQGGPHKSVNFVIAHDGFTMMDLVSYNSKQNTSLSWPFGPSDGGSDGNDSWDSNGDQELRRQQLRNIWTIQYFSRGVPMVVWGDEFARTQNGNNNPYNIDSICTYNNYYMINSDTPLNNTNTSSVGYHNNFGTDDHDDDKNTIFLFSKNIIQLRNTYPSLRQADYSTVIYDYHSFDSWSQTAMIEISGDCDGDSDTKDDGHFLVCMNFHASNSIDFEVPDPGAGNKWVRIIATNNWAEGNDGIWDTASGWSNKYEATPAPYPFSYVVNPRSVIVFQKAAE